MQKKTIVTKTVAAAVAFSMAFTLATGINVDAAKKAPKLNKSKLTLDEGATFKLKVVKNKNKISKVTWKSTKAKVAKVKSGKVTAKKAGSATIKAIFKIKGAKKNTTLKCKVTVKKAETTPEPVVGGWGLMEDTDPKVTPEAIKMVEAFKANNQELGKMVITVYAVLAEKPVSGRAYRVLCRCDFPDENKSSYSIVEVYADQQGEITDDSRLLAFTDSFEAGVFEQFEDPNIPDNIRDDFNKFIEAQGYKEFPYTPIARLASRKSDGKTEVSLVCEAPLEKSSGNIDTNEEVGYFILCVETDENQEHVGIAPLIIPISFIQTDYSVAIEKNGEQAYSIETQAALIRSYLIRLIQQDVTVLSGLSERIKLPIAIDGKDYNTLEEVQALLVSKLSTLKDEFAKCVFHSVPLQIFANDQGLMLGSLGDSSIWLNQDEDGKIKISALNGVFGA